MKHIILPTDFSRNSLIASKYATDLFKNESCVFHIVNCYASLESLKNTYDTAHTVDTTESVNQMVSEKGLMQFLIRLKAFGHRPWHFFRTISSPGLVGCEVRRLIEDTKAEMIIMGTKGASGLQGIYMGSTTVGMIKSVKSCPILAIPENFIFKEPLEIAFATDLQRFYSQSELKPIIDLAKSFTATIRIVNVDNESNPLSEIQQFNLKAIQKYFGTIPNYVHSAGLVSTVSKTLKFFSRELDVHLLGFLNYPKAYLDKVSSDPIVQGVVLSSRLPLLIIPEMSMAFSHPCTRSVPKEAGYRELSIV